MAITLDQDLLPVFPGALDMSGAAQLGSMLATYCIETTGTQEYSFTKDEFLTRFETAYGKAATDEVRPHLNVKLAGLIRT